MHLKINVLSANMKKCILLIRVSTLAQDLQQQTDKVREQAILDGYLPENIIPIEEKESGIKLKEEERLGLNRMKQCIEADSEIDCVYIYELSRLSRRSAVLYSVREYLIEHKIQLICLNPFFKMLDENGKLSESSNLLFGIFSSMSENEMMIKKARFARGIERKKQLGKHHTGRILFGYATEKDGTFIKHPENGRVVQLCFELYLTGKYSTRKLALELQERGYFKQCTIFTAKNNVQNILHNEEYTGSTGKPQLVSKKDFESVLGMMKKNRNSEYRVSHNAICKGLLVDREKGYRLTLNAAAQSYFNTPRKCIWVGQSVVDPIVWEYAMKEHRKFHSMDRDKLRKQLAGKMKILNEKKLVARKKIDELKKRIDMIEERLIMGKISSKKADDLESKVYDEIKLLEALIEQKRSKVKSLAKQINELTDNENKKSMDYDTLTLVVKCGIVKEVIEVIYCWKPKRTELCLEIHNKLTGEICTYHLNSYHKKILSVEKTSTKKKNH